MLFFIGWLLITRRNNYSFQSFFVPILDYFSESRQIGDFTFSFKSIFLFIFIIVISGVISKIVSFLASDTKSSSSNTKSSGLGSYLLLIRIGIIGVGVLIAFASAGIPLDRITIIISALGVGIGFGLQTLVNNLVSGLIIAFEKPVNLNDIIEINGQIGTMKSIGIRSSIINTWDGADVIIPNGDLLSQHLTNWTIGSSKRRFEIQVGVAYGSDLTVVKNILNDVLINNKLVLKNPLPMIWVSKFSDSSIDYSIKYWVPHFNFGNDVRSELLIEIDEAFKNNGIEIPFPQQDIHIQSEIKNTNNNSLEKDN
jgi:potassium efflux system protein